MPRHINTPIPTLKPSETIVNEGHKALREMALEIPIDQIKSDYVQNLITHMKRVLKKESDGVGLAAPQVGIPLRVFIISGKVLLSEEEKNKLNEGDKNIKVPKDLVFINPVITKTSKQKKWMDGEGCLSIRWLYGKVERALRATVKAYDENGKLFVRGGSGLMAHIFQHEIDHLNGILFIDKAKDLAKHDPDETHE